MYCAYYYISPGNAKVGGSVSCPIGFLLSFVLCGLPVRVLWPCDTREPCFTLSMRMLPVITTLVKQLLLSCRMLVFCVGSDPTAPAAVWTLGENISEVITGDIQGYFELHCHRRLVRVGVFTVAIR
jgi:hypothetical protein